MVYRAVHITTYTYEGPVSYCVSEAHLKPRNLPWQHLAEWELQIIPEPVSVASRRDYFGNETATFTVLHVHDRMIITSSSIVQNTRTNAAMDGSPAWEETRALLAKPLTEDALRASEFLWESPYVSFVPGLAAYAQPSFSPGRPIFEAVRELTGRVHRDFRYAPKSTSVGTPLTEVLAKKRGVCQDFAHLMIGSLRSLGLAARYVSGYLRSGQGAEASHAWVSVFIPGSGWVDFDPTNDVVPEKSHLVLAWGRDFSDVTPVKGVNLGGGRHTIEVEVRVKPVPGSSDL